MTSAIRHMLIVLGLLIAVPLALLAALFRHITRRSTRPPRSLWITQPIPTIPLLADAERSIGFTVHTWAFELNRLEQRFDRNLTEARNKPVLGPLSPFLNLIYACLRYDRLHFFCDRGLLPLFRSREFNPIELLLYRISRKQLFFWAYGADVRTRNATLALGSPNCCESCPHPGKYCICDDTRAAANQRRITRAATARFSIGDMTLYTPGSNNALFYWPIDLNDPRYAPAIPDTDPERPLRILHAPNHRHFKGTDHLIAAVENLRTRGLSVELQLVENLTHDQALAQYRNADVIFDQCLIGFHGYFALEAMALAKPVLCFIRNPQRDLLAPNACPIINIRPEAIEREIERLCLKRELLPQLGSLGRTYIETYYSLSACSQRLALALSHTGASVP